MTTPPIFENLPLSNIVRPKWDIKVLKEIGFKNIETDLNGRRGTLFGLGTGTLFRNPFDLKYAP